MIGTVEWNQMTFNPNLPLFFFLFMFLLFYWRRYTYSTTLNSNLSRNRNSNNNCDVDECLKPIKHIFQMLSKHKHHRMRFNKCETNAINEVYSWYQWIVWNCGIWHSTSQSNQNFKRWWSFRVLRLPQSDCCELFFKKYTVSIRSRGTHRMSEAMGEYSKEILMPLTARWWLTLRVNCHKCPSFFVQQIRNDNLPDVWSNVLSFQSEERDGAGERSHAMISATLVTFLLRVIWLFLFNLYDPSYTVPHNYRKVYIEREGGAISRTFFFPNISSHRSTS